MPITRAKNGVSVFTWALKPSAAALGQGRTIFISDIGVNGSWWYSDGTQWIPEQPIVLVQESGGWLVPALITGDAATYSQSGTTVTVTSTGHNMTNVLNGHSVYLDISTGTAAAGWYTNFTYSSANAFTCTSATSLTTSGAVLTRTAATTVTPISYTIPAGILGPTGVIEITTLSSVFDSINDKTLAAKLASTSVATRLLTTSGGVAQEETHRVFLKTAATQVANNASSVGDAGESANAIARTTVDFSADVAGTFAITVATASEWAALEAVQVKLFPSY